MSSRTHFTAQKLSVPQLQGHINQSTFSSAWFPIPGTVGRWFIWFMIWCAAQLSAVVYVYAQFVSSYCPHVCSSNHNVDTTTFSRSAHVPVHILVLHGTAFFTWFTAQIPNLLVLSLKLLFIMLSCWQMRMSMWVGFVIGPAWSWPHLAKQISPPP